MPLHEISHFKSSGEQNSLAYNAVSCGQDFIDPHHLNLCCSRGKAVNLAVITELHCSSFVTDAQTNLCIFPRTSTWPAFSCVVKLQQTLRGQRTEGVQDFVLNIEKSKKVWVIWQLSKTLRKSSYNVKTPFKPSADCFGRDDHHSLIAKFSKIATWDMRTVFKKWRESRHFARETVHSGNFCSCSSPDRPAKNCFFVCGFLKECAVAIPASRICKILQRYYTDTFLDIQTLQFAQ